MNNHQILWQGPLHKLDTRIETSSGGVEYFLGDTIPLHTFVGKKIRLEYQGKIECSNCGRSTKKSWSQGYCYPCSLKLPSCDICMVRPEKCHFHLGTCRDSAWGEKNCFIPHIVYLSHTSGLKIGITREYQKHTRWADQGARYAQPMLRVQNRLDAGAIEIFLAQYFPDKTHWQKLISEDTPEEDLFPAAVEKLELLLKEAPHLPVYERLREEKESFVFPILKYPSKKVSLNIEKLGFIEGELLGMKGQYLFFQEGAFNVRQYAGLHVQLQSGG